MKTFDLSILVGVPTRNLGAEIVPEGVRYTAWAPERTKVEVMVKAEENGSPRRFALHKNEHGYFIGVDVEGRAGDLYSFEIDGRDGLPDLASRYQPRGIFGLSMVIDPQAYHWQAIDWKRPGWQGHVIYELHVGTFTQAGTFRAAIDRLDYLHELGVTVIELMPVAECTGERNWGYDGTLLFAPYHAYGHPDDLRALVDACHAHGLAVMLDVVYNHIGAVGDPTDAYSGFLSHPENTGAWGKSYNLHGKHSAPVRHLLLQNLDYWLREFCIDGFRFDATHAIRDESEKHWLMLASELIHAHGAFATAEDDRNSAELLKPLTKGGWELDAMWADDFHHTFRISQTRESHSYLGRFTGSAEEIADTLRHGWYFRGQNHPKLEQPRGSACNHLPPEQFIYCMSNHDQVGNRAFGERLHQSISLEAYRALSLFFCFVPYTPLLFMGQEWAASTPFLYFTDHPGDFGPLVSEGRKKEFQFDAQEHGRPIPDCQAESTFRDSKLRWDELDKPPYAGVLALYREGLKKRCDFFGNKNPDRKSWRVDFDSTQLSLTYDLSSRLVKVTLALDRREMAAIPGETILRSSEARFGNDSGKGPETMVGTLCR
ncbi:MAG: malto-oligosyltrehalose trehalohydrolase [Methylacidiphilales bacterium]|nr:malto-oligosyltrehalose trehalohydrolase [Candidatus Methylacidiphilales bacterium]